MVNSAPFRGHSCEFSEPLNEETFILPSTVYRRLSAISELES